MAGSVNRAIIVGNLGRDPEIRSLPNGDKVASLSIATSEQWRDKATGERKEKTEWHRVSVFNENIVKVCENYLQKGSTVYIEGQIQTRKWTDQAGVEKYSTEIVLQKFNGVLTMLGGRSDGGSDRSSSSGEDYSSGFASGGSSSGQARVKESYDLSDDIPFIRMAGEYGI